MFTPGYLLLKFEGWMIIIFTWHEELKFFRVKTYRGYLFSGFVNCVKIFSVESFNAFQAFQQFIW